MNYLAVDTSGKHLTVIIKIGDKYASKFMENTNLQHSVTLMPQIEKMLLQMEESLSSIDVFCAVVGAGSFTGIRIGISTVKAFSYALGKKVLSVTSFETLAYNRQGKVVSVIDAKHDNFYAQCFSNGAAESKAEFITLEKLNELAKTYKVVTSEELSNISSEIVSLEEGLKLAVEKNLDKATTDRDSLVPLYCKRSQAEEGI